MDFSGFPVASSHTHFFITSSTSFSSLVFILLALSFKSCSLTQKRDVRLTLEC